MDLALNPLETRNFTKTHVTVASPRVGESNFEKLFESFGIGLKRLVLEYDPIPKVPFCFGYTHVGTQIQLRVASDDTGISKIVPHGILHYYKSVQELVDDKCYREWSQQ